MLRAPAVRLRQDSSLTTGGRSTVAGSQETWRLTGVFKSAAALRGLEAVQQSFEPALGLGIDVGARERVAQVRAVEVAVARRRDLYGRPQRRWRLGGDSCRRSRPVPFPVAFVRNDFLAAQPVRLAAAGE